MVDNEEPIDLEWERDKEKAAVSKAVVLSDEEKEAAYRRIDTEYADRKDWKKKESEREEKEIDQEARRQALQAQTDSDREAMAEGIARINAEKFETIRAAEASNLEEHESATAPINENIVTNQAFKQSISNLVAIVNQTKKVTAESNYLKVNDKKIQTEAKEYFEKLELELTQIVEQIDTGADPIPVNRNRQVKKWFENNWPEAIDKFNEFANKKAMAEIFVKTGIVGAFGLAGLTVGVVFSIPLAVSFGAGSFLGMWATGQISSKEAVKRVEDHLEDDS